MSLIALLTLGCISPKDALDTSETAAPPETGIEETGLEETGLDTPPVFFKNPLEAADLDPRDEVVRVQLTAAPYTYESAGTIIEGWAYNQQVPGPTIRVPLGARLEVELINQLENGTTIHWHGVHVPWEMDGVVWMGEPIQSGTEFTYAFTPDQSPGTFWYHPHYDTQRQVDLGLYGTLLIEDPSEPRVDHELIAVLDSTGEFGAGDLEGVHHGLEATNIEWTVNALHKPVYPAKSGDSIRLRILNASNTGYAYLKIPGARQIAGDQGILPQPKTLEMEPLLLAPGDRSDVEILLTGDLEILSAPYNHNGGEAFGEDQVVFRIEASDDTLSEEEPELLDWPFTHQTPSNDPGRTDIRWTLTGDPRTGSWEINGETFPDVTIPELSLNEEAILEVRNMSATEHPFHLHGHAFEVLSINGESPQWAMLEDTINIPIRGIARLRLVANNPGDWMAHCHILSHPHGGMMTVLRVNDP
ncbi:MAG: multicopper oxidase family protein [Myxococcota bacterium]|nr:multicopper oxidase family protein [Myxococcota bacterium]